MVDGYALEGIFRRVRLDCKQLNDPALQVALLLHNSQTANEVFLLSLRDCVVTLPDSHPLRRWVQQKSLREATPLARKIAETLEGPLKGVWASGHAMTAPQRQQLISLLDELEDELPYLDYLVLRAVGYLKLGNWARTEKIISQWLERDPIERMQETPWREDILGRHTLGLMNELFATLAKGLEGKVIVDLFFQAVQDFYTDPELLKAAERHQELSERELLNKLSLRYHRSFVPGYAAWMCNRGFEGNRRKRFLDNFFETKEAGDRLWIFLGRLPDEASHREALARLLAEKKDKHPEIFYALASEPSLSGVLNRVAPESIKNLLKGRRQLYMQQFEKDSHDAWSLSQLVEMGQIDEALVQDLSR